MKFRNGLALLFMGLMFGATIIAPATAAPVVAGSSLGGAGDSPGAPKSGKQVLILDLPRFDLRDIAPQAGAPTQYPHFMKLVESAAVGMMATPLSDPLTLEKVYLSFNSGAQVRVSPDTNAIYNCQEELNGEPAGEFFRAMTGVQAPTNGVVNLGIPKMIQQNDPALQPSLGLFGELLHDHGIHTAAFGNADTDILSRSGATMIMDPNGIIDAGDVSRETLRADPLFPYGFRTNCDQILNDWGRLKDKAQVILITLGDLERIERFGVYLDQNRWNEYRKVAMGYYDDFLGRLLPQIDFEHTMLLVFSALPPGKELTPGSRLTPVIAKGPGLQAGLLSSNSTRQKGIVTCYDLPLSLLRFLGIKRQGLFNGYPLKSTAGSWQAIPSEQSSFIENYNIRWPLLTGFAYVLIGIFLLAIIGFILGFHPKIIRSLEVSYLFLLAFPAVFLLEALINPLHWALIAGWTLGLAGIIFLVAFFSSRRRLFKTLALMSGITVAIIIVDGLFNGHCELRSFLGYSAVAGARFYGIGNEYLGFLLGAYIVAVSCGMNWLKRYPAFARHAGAILWSLVILITILLIHPEFGSTIGGGLTAFLGLSVTTCLWLKRPLRLQIFIRLAAVLTAIFLLVVFWDYYLNRSSMTHLGQLITALTHGNFRIVEEMATRKLQLNLRLINYSIWGQILIGVLVVIPMLYKRPPQVAARFFEKYPDITRGFLGLVITALFGLFINDSGIVTAATIFVFGAIMLLMAVSAELSGGSPPN